MKRDSLSHILTALEDTEPQAKPLPHTTGNLQTPLGRFQKAKAAKARLVQEGRQAKDKEPTQKLSPNDGGSAALPATYITWEKFCDEAASVMEVLTPQMKAAITGDGAFIFLFKGSITGDGALHFLFKTAIHRDGGLYPRQSGHHPP